MNENFEDELSAEEYKALNGLAREKEPPARLEELLVTRLKEAQLIQRRNLWRRSVPTTLVKIAAAVLLVVMGTLIGAKWFARPASNTPQFMLVLKSSMETSQPRSSEEIMSLVREYGNWARQLREQGVRVEGEKLKQEIRVLGDDGNQPSSEELPSVREKRISGYFLIDAQDYDQAVRIATGCPHLKYGGTIEVRQIDRF